jgi:hypothetical protein
LIVALEAPVELSTPLGIEDLDFEHAHRRGELFNERIGLV